VLLTRAIARGGELTLRAAFVVALSVATTVPN
jgi:hypothetical protein